ncbi:hypothetical protein [Amycolatopsis palatopharyngis]|uniref:hypothetical protein n=1 Tax=Amycolatopsis palatopharyngis TaxID=187982 RepID=UPI0013BE94AA|nr:hypothetical protein [Amycolatopsis palatopharyngis]
MTPPTREETMNAERPPHNFGPPPFPPPYPAPGQFPQPPASYPKRTSGTTSFGRCLLASLVWVGVTLVISFAALGPPSSGRALGQVLGGMLIPLLLAALTTWLFFRRKHTAFWILAITALPAFVILVFLVTAARLAGQQ